MAVQGINLSAQAIRARQVPASPSYQQQTLDQILSLFLSKFTKLRMALIEGQNSIAADLDIEALLTHLIKNEKFSKLQILIICYKFWGALIKGEQKPDQPIDIQILRQWAKNEHNKAIVERNLASVERTQKNPQTIQRLFIDQQTNFAPAVIPFQMHGSNHPITSQSAKTQLIKEHKETTNGFTIYAKLIFLARASGLTPEQIKAAAENLSLLNGGNKNVLL